MAVEIRPVPPMMKTFMRGSVMVPLAVVVAAASTVAAMSATVAAVAVPAIATMPAAVAAPEVGVAQDAPLGHLVGRAVPVGRGEAQIHAVDDVGIGKGHHIPA